MPSIFSSTCNVCITAVQTIAATVFSCVASRNKRCRSALEYWPPRLNNRQPLPYLCSCGSKNRAGRSLPLRRPATNVALGPAGFDPLKHFPHSPPKSFKFGLSPISVGFGLRAPGWAEGPARRPSDPKGSQVFSLTHHQPTTQISWVRPVAHPPRRYSPGRTGRRFCESRYSLSAQIPAQSATQSSLQFSAPCRPHCGSAFAPPRLRAPGNLVQTRTRILTISLFRRGARSGHCPGWNCSF